MKAIFSFQTTLVLIFCAIVGTAQAQSQEEINRNIGAYMEQVNSQWQIAGSALAITKDGQTVFAQGFGTLEKGTDKKVDAESVFQIGSVSKSFTAVLMGMMVDEGHVQWNDPVKKHLPDFEMYDPWVSDNLQVRDLFLHRTGLEEQQGTYLPNLGFFGADIYRMLRFMKPTTSLRTSYDYNNITFIPAAMIIEKYTGRSWEENVMERIFKPLGMSKSSVNEEGFKATANGNIPHEYLYKDGAPVVNPLYGEEQALHWLSVIGPAGGVNSTVVDMLQYIRFHMGDGKVNEKQILSKATLDYLHRGQLITSQNDEKITLYGLCWFIEQNHHYRVRFHTGTTWGFTALCVQVPELGLGMMWLSNTEVPSSPRYAIMRRLIDLYMGVPDKDYSTEFYADWLESESKTQESPKETLTDPLPLRKYEGKYFNQKLNHTAIVKCRKDTLYITIGTTQWTHKMVYKEGQKFEFRSDGHGFPLTFVSTGNKADGFVIDYGYDEDFGLWKKK